jgi:cobalt/nickel transport system permease protein
MLLAVHIGNNVLTPSWELGGFALAGVLLVVGAWRLREDEVSRVALLTAVFFIASSIHVRLWPGSVHLLLNGLVGIVLGWRAVPALFVGLLLQAALLDHGGYTALGVNTCVVTAPALVAWGLFRLLHRVSWLRHPAARSLLVAIAAALWFLSGVASLSLLTMHLGAEAGGDAIDRTVSVLLHPATPASALLFAVAVAWLERRLENAPEFALGLLVGIVAVLLTVALNCGVLIAGGAYFGATPPLVLAVLHLPVAAVEGVVMGFTVGFLAKVKPELLGPHVSQTTRH